MVEMRADNVKYGKNRLRIVELLPSQQFWSKIIVDISGWNVPEVLSESMTAPSLVLLSSSQNSHFFSVFQAFFFPLLREILF